MLHNFTSIYGEITCEIRENFAPHDLVIINGNLATHRWWQPTLKELTKNWQNLDTKRSLIILDLPGCGPGSKVAHQIDFTRLVEIYKNRISQYSFTSPPYLLGHSTGGLIAAHLNASTRSNFKRVLLLNPVGPQAGTMNEQLELRYRRMQEDFDYCSKVIAATIYKCDSEAPFFRDVVLPDAFQSVLNVGDKIVRSMSGLDSTEIYKSQQAPVTLIYGKHDSVISLKDIETAPKLSRKIQLKILEQCGHCPNLEDPPLMADLLIEFMNSP